MASKTEIANWALTKVGERRVADIETTDNIAAIAINDIYDRTRDALLTSYPWNFAIKRASIAKNANSPEWEYTNAYTLPSDFLSLLKIKNDPDYRIENFEDALCILSDEGSPLKIRYISKITAEGLQDPLFDAALAAELAVQICERLTQSNTKKQILIAERDAVVASAFASDAIQDPPQELRPDEWLTAREEGLDDEIDYNP